MITRDEALAAGLNRYFTGKPCPSGHISERRVRGYYCIECQKLSHQAYYAENKDACDKKSSKWRAENPEAARALRAKHAAKPESKEKRKIFWAKYRESGHCQAVHKKWRDANPEKTLKWSREGRVKHKERNAATRKIWTEKNREKTRSFVRNRRARIRGASGQHSASDIEEIKRLQKGKCAYCRVRLFGSHSVDHILALSKGGGNDRTNLQILCGPCNSRKHDADPIDFARRLGRLI